VHTAREGELPYPQRAIRTKDFLYIVNFEPDRWPMGDPRGMDNSDAAPLPYHDLQWKHFVAYPDMDASPTKAWMIHHRNEDNVQLLYRLAFDKRPYEELYDLRSDPDYMVNVAEDAAYAGMRRELHDRLMRVLSENNDPRVTENPCRYEHAPYAGPLQPFQK
jgi:uncharacterized sulfatase